MVRYVDICKAQGDDALAQLAGARGPFDRIEWLDLDEAEERLTYDHDRDLLAAVKELL